MSKDIYQKALLNKEFRQAFELLLDRNFTSFKQNGTDGAA